MFKLHVLNPGDPPQQRRRKAKKSAKRKARATAKAPMKRKKSGHRKAKRRARRGGVAIISTAPGKRKGHRRRRRHNPGGLAKLGKMGLPKGADIGGLLLAVLGVSAATKALAGGTPAFDSGPTSLAGEPWSIKQYAAAAALAMFGGRLADRVIRGSGSAFRLGVVGVIIAKTVMPMASRIPFAGRYLGETDGDVRVDEDGQSWLMQGGKWQALQGMPANLEGMGALAYETPLDGLGALVEATALDGTDDLPPSYQLNDKWQL